MKDCIVNVSACSLPAVRFVRNLPKDSINSDDSLKHGRLIRPLKRAIFYISTLGIIKSIVFALENRPVDIKVGQQRKMKGTTQWILVMNRGNLSRNTRPRNSAMTALLFLIYETSSGLVRLSCKSFQTIFLHARKLSWLRANRKYSENTPERGGFAFAKPNNSLSCDSFDLFVDTEIRVAKCVLVFV